MVVRGTGVPRGGGLRDDQAHPGRGLRRAARGETLRVEEQREAAPLNELTDFSWDEVNLFNEYTPRDEIEAAVGSPVIEGDASGSGTSLLVFEEDGKVVDTVTVTGDYLRADGRAGRTM